MFNPKMMQTAQALTDYCNASDEASALNELYAETCVSVEALDMPGGPMGREAKGLDAIRGKHEWWFANNEVHESTAEGPFMHGDDKFSIIFYMDVTDKTSGERVQMKEVALYTTNADGKVTREEFFYPPMG